MSYRCAVTGRVQPHGDKPIQVVTKKRARAYYDSANGKPGLKVGGDGEPAEVIGTGWEVEREMFVSRAGLERLREQGLVT